MVITLCSSSRSRKCFDPLYRQGLDSRAPADHSPPVLSARCGRAAVSPVLWFCACGRRVLTVLLESLTAQNHLQISAAPSESQRCSLQRNPEQSK